MAEVLWPLAEEQEVSKMFEEVEPLMQMLPNNPVHCDALSSYELKHN